MKPNNSSYTVRLSNKWENWSLHSKYGNMLVEGINSRAGGDYNRVVISVFKTHNLSEEHAYVNSTWFTPDEIDDLITVLRYAQSVAKGEIEGETIL